LLVSKLIPSIGLAVSLNHDRGFGGAASTATFEVPQNTALRIRLDNTPTSAASKVGDPFSATVVDESEYRDAGISLEIANQ
jgi:hypothetical protein